MKIRFDFLAIAGASLLLLSCASPPTADPSKVGVACAQQCSKNLTDCSRGFKLFPVVAQKQCNDTYDTCIQGCPARAADSSSSASQASTSDRLKKLDELYQSGSITKDEYDEKRRDILNSL